VVAGLALLYILFRILKAVSYLFSRGEGVKSRGERKHLREARKTLKHGDFVSAGRSFQAGGEYEQAADAYMKGGRYILAGEAYLSRGRYLDAARAFDAGGVFEKAADLYEKSNRFDLASEAYLKTGRKEAVARMWERSGNLDKAALIYEDLEKLEKAAECWEKLKEPAKAGRLLHTHFRRELDGVNREHDSAKEGVQFPAIQAIGRKAGEFLLKAGIREDAAECFFEAKLYAEAAPLLVELGDYTRAAAAFKEAGDMVRAAECFEKAGDPEQAEAMLAEHHKASGDKPRAAELFEKSGRFAEAAELMREERQFIRAAELYSKVENWVRAAENYAMGGDFSMAGECYFRAGDFKLAADCYRHTGDLERMAEVLDAGGMYVEAGAAFQKAGNMERACVSLRRVKKNDFRNFKRAAALLGDILREMGELAAAREQYQEITGSEPISEENVEAHYKIASIYVEEGDFQKARLIFEKIIGFSYNYKDALLKLEEVRAQEMKFLTPSPDTGPFTPSSMSAAKHSSDVFLAGRYKIKSEIGRGGMGIVYKAEDTMLGRTVAYKELMFTGRGDQKAVMDFQREAKNAAILNHPNIVTIYDIGGDGTNYYIIMEFIEGRNLRSILKFRGGPFTIEEGLSIMNQLCEGLSYAHEKKIIHRDIKTANIMLSKNGEVKILDFGLARMVEEVTREVSKVMGTPAYMSPEQIQGRDLDNRSDIYSLGVVLFEIFTGQLPFPEGDFGYQHVHTPPPDPRSITPHIPGTISRIILRCMEKDRDRRFQDASDILKLLSK
jgi:tetratricopeptide (TPR) repeat protein